MFLMHWLIYCMHAAVPLSIWWRISVLVYFWRKLLARKAVISFSSLLHMAHPPLLPHPKLIRTRLIDFNIITTITISDMPLYPLLLCYQIRTKKKVLLPRFRPLRLLVTWGKLLRIAVLIRREKNNRLSPLLAFCIF